MSRLLDSDRFSAVSSRGKGAIEYVRHQLRDILFGDDIAPSVTRHGYRILILQSHADPIHSFKPTLVELTSESQPIDNHLRFHAMQVTNEQYKLPSFMTPLLAVFHVEWQIKTTAINTYILQDEKIDPPEEMTSTLA
ncbi:hypothetical protein N657DRAFT_675804 [Parathielavia appendiculata]|uniref:Uncharacterized protein n=1 Tax=Parathielavia appendiculata TaxID=2587402 RepID=A0AAN6YYA5_9PEZI|nr:hypothetical protein N657DRAFT_675804 [Parathielavia appendiculata]